MRGGKGYLRMSIPSAQFYCELKMALKKKVQYKSFLI